MLWNKRVKLKKLFFCKHRNFKAELEKKAFSFYTTSVPFDHGWSFCSFGIPCILHHLGSAWNSSARESWSPREGPDFLFPALTHSTFECARFVRQPLIRNSVDCFGDRLTALILSFLRPSQILTGLVPNTRVTHLMYGNRLIAWGTPASAKHVLPRATLWCQELASSGHCICLPSQPSLTPVPAGGAAPHLPKPNSLEARHPISPPNICVERGTV